MFRNFFANQCNFVQTTNEFHIFFSFAQQFDIYTKTLLKTIDLLLTMMNKAEFCKECGKIVKTIIESPVHCAYINDAIATLFEYMVYDFNGNFLKINEKQ